MRFYTRRFNFRNFAQTFVSSRATSRRPLIVFTISAAVFLGPQMVRAAGGVIVANGGGAIACFGDTQPGKVVGGVLMPAGDRAVGSVVAVEYFLADAEDSLAPDFIDRDSPKSEAEISAKLMARTLVEKSFYRSLSFFKSKMVFEESDYNGAIGAFIDSSDWVLPFTLPVGCLRVQAALQYNILVFLHPLVWSHLSNTQRAILKFHEFVYRLGVHDTGMESSKQTQELISYLISKHYSPAGFRAKLRQLGFVGKISKISGL